jgi:hypothetical protein
MLNSAARKKSPTRSPRFPRSPSPRRITRAATAATAAAAASPKKAASPSASPRAATAATATPSASPRVSPRATTSATAAKAAKAAKAAPKKKIKDPYETPFWPPSNYQVPAKVVFNSPTPLPRTLAKHKAFIVELKKVLITEKVIDRDSPLFKELLAEQQKYNMRFYRLKPHNIICFVKCEYYQYDKSTPRVFHRGNKEPYYGNFKFVNLLKKNNMDMKWFGKNMLYIHKNRF